MRVGVDILQPYPGAEFAERLSQIEKLRADLAVFPRARRIFQIDAIGRGVLRNDQQFLDPRGYKFLRLAQHVIGRPRHQVAAQFWDNAKAAAIIATL